MSASYSNAKTVLDTNTLLSYIQKTFPTCVAVTNNDGINVIAYFSAALSAGNQTTLTALIQAYQDPITGIVDEVNISLYNVSNVNLASSGIFTASQWEDVSRFASAIISVSANTAGSMQLQYGLLAAQVDSSKTYAVAAGVPITGMCVSIPGRYFRIVYTNGATAQTSFALQTRYSVSPILNSGDYTTAINDNVQMAYSRAVITARNDNNMFTGIRADEERRLRMRPSLLNANEMKTPVPIIQLSFSYLISPDTTTTTLVSSGTSTINNGTVVLSTAAAASSSSTIASRRYINIGSGRVVQASLSVAFATGVASSSQIIGLGSSEFGIFIGYLGVSFGVMTRTGSTDTWTAQAAFNIDALNGTGPSAVTLTPTNGNSYGIIYDTTGYGSIAFTLMSSSISEPVVFHRIQLNQSATPVFRAYGSPLLAQIANTTNTTLVSMRVSSMSAFTNSPTLTTGPMKSVEMIKTISNTAYTPVLSISNAGTYTSLSNTISLILKTLSISCDGTKGSIMVGVWDNATLVNSSYSSVASSPASLDTAATSMSGGTLLFSFPLYRSASKIMDMINQNIVVSPNNAITIASRCSISGVSNALALSATFIADM
jgi:hypothetical protein